MGSDRRVTDWVELNHCGGCSLASRLMASADAAPVSDAPVPRATNCLNQAEQAYVNAISI